MIHLKFQVSINVHYFNLVAQKIDSENLCFMYVLQCNAHCGCLVKLHSAFSQTDIKARESNFCVTFSRNIIC